MNCFYCCINVRVKYVSVIILLLYAYNNTANSWGYASGRMTGDEFACDELRRLGQIEIAGDEFACDELRRLGRIGIGVMNSANWNRE